MINYSDWLNKGKNLFYDKCKSKEAIVCFDIALDLKKMGFEAYTEKANVLRFLNNNQQALKVIDQSILLNKHNNIAYFIKSRILLSLNQKKKHKNF